MRVISRRALAQFWEKHAGTEASLRNWYRIVKTADWRTFAEVRQTFRNADLVKVGSGKTAVVFNVGGNNTRLAAAVHYNRGKVFVLKVMTHAEYNRDRWKDEL